MTLLMESIKAVNLPYTVMLLVVIVYWSTVILGFFDIESLDFDVEMEHEGVLGSLVHFLEVFNLGRVPVSVWLSAFSIVAWVISVNLNFATQYLPFDIPEFVKLFGFALLILPLSAIAAKVLTTPFKKVFNTLHKSEDADLMGKLVTITSTRVTDDFGRAEYHNNGAPLILEVRSTGDETLQEGDQAKIFKHEPESNIYYVMCVAIAVNQP